MSKVFDDDLVKISSSNVIFTKIDWRFPSPFTMKPLTGFTLCQAYSSTTHSNNLSKCIFCTIDKEKKNDGR